MKNSLFYKISAWAGCFLLFGFSACTPDTKTLKPGMWRGVLLIARQEVPFQMEVKNTADGKTVAYLINGKERILLDQITVAGDSVKIPLHIFDADLKAHLNDQENRLEGTWTRYNLAQPFKVKFSAQLGLNHRFSRDPKPATFAYSGKWDVTFNYADGTKEEAIGVFDQKENKLTGTFLSATGDYRYLDGEVTGDKLSLSTFDGSHGYLWTAKPKNETELTGKYYSGPANISTWVARKNDLAVLPAADTLTYLKEGYDQLRFTFPNLAGKKVSLGDPKFRGKVVVVQLMGSWCPNCMDETAYLAPFYEKTKTKGLEVIGLAYEQTPDFEKSKARLEKLRNRFNIQYEILVAGTRDKAEAAKTLPMLNHVLAFPTTILIDRKGHVRKIHTGFSGPGTGKYYEEFVSDFERTIDKLLKE